MQLHNVDLCRQVKPVVRLHSLSLTSVVLSDGWHEKCPSSRLHCRSCTEMLVRSRMIKCQERHRPIKPHIQGNQSSWIVLSSYPQASCLLWVETPLWQEGSAQERCSAWVTTLPDEPPGALCRKQNRNKLLLCVIAIMVGLIYLFCNHIVVQVPRPK